MKFTVFYLYRMDNYIWRICLTAFLCSLISGSFLQLHKSSKQPSRTKVLIRYFLLTLTLNNFLFNGIDYLQRKGRFVGISCAQTPTDIFMIKFTNVLIYYCKKVFSNFFCSLIEDIFLPLEWDKKTSDFIEKLSSCFTSIKFDYKCWKNN